MCTSVDQYIYQEGDLINNIYFLYKGLVGFAIPSQKSYYIIIEEGDTFGVVDIVYDNQDQKQNAHVTTETDMSSIDDSDYEGKVLRKRHASRQAKENSDSKI